MQIRHVLARLVALLAVAALFAEPAHAYIDGATGSMILQAAMASLFAAAFTVKLYWRRLRTWFKRRREPAQLESAGNDQ